jgi:xanthine dehydrogenase accessory factor
MPSWLQALSELEREGEPSVLVTVVSARGSTPREAGCKMVVTRDALFDTIGGGNLEFQCESEARALLGRGEAVPVTRDYPLGPALGQCCGGHVSVLFEPMRPAGGHVALFGAGHVGRALVRLLGDLPGRVTWIDSRPDAFPDAVPANVRCRVTEDPAGEIAALPAGTMVLVMTHDHQIDFEIIATALRRDDFLGIGLIGSATKRARFVSRLGRLGLDTSRMICPIGVPGVESKLPAAIAVGVAAQILQMQGQRQGQQQERSVWRSDTEPLQTACNGCVREGAQVCS